MGSGDGEAAKSGHLTRVTDRPWQCWRRADVALLRISAAWHGAPCCVAPEDQGRLAV
jgi:hypothetical protein